jgi:D-glycero-D-manno-heptose 1,7-bisphosphate phosphatase
MHNPESAHGMTGKKNKALFLDRDGVINEDSAYPYKPEHIIFKEGIFDFCRKAVEKGYLLVVVTNQAGVAKGKFTEDDVKALHVWMGNQFQERHIPVAGFYYCPFHKDGVVPRYAVDSEWRKPKPGMILQAMKDLDIDETQSIMIGDKLSDRIALAGLRSIILKSNYTPHDYNAENFEELQNMI